MLIRKIRQVGNSVALAIPNEIFDFLNLNPQKNKYKLCQDDTGSVFIIILDENVSMIDEKKFQKQGTVYAIIIPKPLCNMWNVGLHDGAKREIALYLDDSPLKWKIEPV